MKELLLCLGTGAILGISYKLLQNWNFGRHPVQVFVTADDEETPLVEPVGYMDEWAILYSDGSLHMVQMPPNEGNDDEWLTSQ